MPPIPAGPKKAEPEDIFAGTGLGGRLQYPGTPDPTASIAESPAKGFGRKLLRLVIFLAIAAIVVVGGYYAYGYALKMLPAKSPVASTNAPVTNENSNQPAVVTVPTVPPVIVPPVVTNVNVNVPPPVVPAILPQDDPNSTVDSDGDGLTDYEETHTYHTDPYKVDTDNDGLSDRDEVITWKTNPLNSDTDGDSYLDGAEVKGGYNPNGPGKLLPPVIKQ